MDETVLSIVSGVIGVIFGGMITWFVAYKYYRKAANELSTEASDLKRLNDLLLQGMETQGWIRINRHPDGSIAGFEKAIETQGLDSFRPGSHTVGH